MVEGKGWRGQEVAASPGCQAAPFLLPVQQQRGQGPLLSDSPCLLLPSPVLPWKVPAG